MSVVRHFTATAYVVHDGRVALHWHPKVKAWLPPGGHIEENEDPVQAVLRETEEETGLKTVVVPTGPAIDLSFPVLVQPPLTLWVRGPLPGRNSRLAVRRGPSFPCKRGFLMNEPLRTFQKQFIRGALAPGVDVAGLSIPRGNGKSWLAAHLLRRCLTPGDDLHVPGSEYLAASGVAGVAA